MLRSVLHTALSGVRAAELAVGVTANNLANSLTDGFKSSRVVFADQSPQSLGQSGAPGASSGGRNPIQLGRGVRIAAVAGDHSQGPIVPAGDPLNLALEGEGFFVLEGKGGERLFSREGNFHRSAAGELVSHAGRRVLGYNVEGNHPFDSGDLKPVRVHPDGAAGAEVTSISVGEDGTIRGHFSDGIVRDSGQIALARFANPGGLLRRGENSFSANSNSGPPTFAAPGSTRVVSGAREQSNTDIAGELVDLSLFSTMFRVNLQVFTTGDALLQELLSLRRI